MSENIIDNIIEEGRRMFENETIADIIAVMRRGTRLPGYWRSCDVNKILQYHADRLEKAKKREAQSIERIVRDAIIDYNGMYPSAPNDEAERDLRERAARANAWLKQHGFEEEPFHWSKEETPCL